jgi:hypothetical protein
MNTTHFEIIMYLSTVLVLMTMVAYCFYYAGYEKGKRDEARRQMFFTPSELHEMRTDLSKSDAQLQDEQDDRIKRLNDLTAFEEQL